MDVLYLMSRISLLAQSGLTTIEVMATCIMRGVQPNTALFRHYFFPQIQPRGAISGCVTWIPRSKGAYPDGAVKERWEEWRGR